MQLQVFGIFDIILLTSWKYFFSFAFGGFGSVIMREWPNWNNQNQYYLRNWPSGHTGKQTRFFHQYIFEFIEYFWVFTNENVQKQSQLGMWQYWFKYFLYEQPKIFFQEKCIFFFFDKPSMVHHRLETNWSNIIFIFMMLMLMLILIRFHLLIECACSSQHELLLNLLEKHDVAVRSNFHHFKCMDTFQ